MAAPARRPPAPKAPARIGTCQAEFHVAAAHGPLSSPEILLAAVRQEILPALPEVLDDPVWQGLRIDAPVVEIDLGTWPDEPIWSEVRHVLALKLRQTLEAYRQSDRHREVTADTRQPVGTAEPCQPKTDTQRKDPFTDVASAGPLDAAPAPKSRDAQQAPPQRQHKDHLTDVISSEPLDPAPAPKPKQAQQTSPQRQRDDPVAAPNPSERLTDPGPSAALKAFSDWLDAQEKARDKAEILAHLATRPSLQAALLLWESADAQARQTALPMTGVQRQEVQSAAERLATRSLPRPEAGHAPSKAPQLPANVDENSMSGLGDPPDNFKASTPRPAQVLQAEESARMDCAKLRHRLATETTPQADALRAAAHRLATLLHASGIGADHAREHSMVLLAGLLSDSDFADMLGKQARLNSAGFGVETPPLSIGAEQETTKGAKAGQTGPDPSNTPSKRPDPIVRDSQADGKAQPGNEAVSVPSAPEDGLDARSALDDSDVPRPSVRAIAALAASLDPDAAARPESTSALRDHVQHQFSQRPAIVFDAAQALDHLPTLAALLDVSDVSDVNSVGDVSDVANAVLFGTEALPAHQIKRLYHANPNALRRALQGRPVADLSRLATRLLPDSATLLRAQIGDLDQQAAHPEQALQKAILAILATRPLDVEALRTVAPDDPARETLPAPLGAVEGAQNDQPPRPSPDPMTEEPARTGTGHPVADTPLRALLSLSGLNDAEIDRVTAAPSQETPARDPSPAQSAQKQSDAQQDAGSATLHPSQRSDAVLHAHLQKLAAATNPARGDIFADVLALIWSVWPQTTPKQSDPSTNGFALLRAQLAAQATATDRSLGALVQAALPMLEPDLDRHTYALRTVLARVSSLTGPDVTGLRASTRDTVEHLLAPTPDETPQPQPPARPSTPVQTDSSAFADATSAEQVLQVTESAGLVLLHPFITLLFDRLKIERDRKSLVKDHLPRALGALQFLAGEAAPNDPLHRVLLGLDAAVPLPEAETPDEEARVLMDGLLRSVIERWGRLGATSPDGLRETFIRRTGTLRFDENGARLRVTPGPFDMLLDSLPWALSPVALPWMPLPCIVSWREDEDA